MAFLAAETVGMEFRFLFRLQILAFDASIAVLAEGIVQLVVMSSAVWMVMHDVEVCCLEWRLASLAHKALLVVATGKSPIC